MALKQPNVLIITSPDSPELKALDPLANQVNVMGIGRTMDDLEHLSDEQWASVDVLLNCGVGEKAGARKDIQEMWPRLKGLQWMHSASAGLDKLLFPELQASGVSLTNARGVYSHSLAEYVMTCCNWFAKDLPRMRAAQARREWEPFEVEELRGKTMGIVGYGDIGRACGRLAKAFKMRVLGLRRRAQLSQEDEPVVDRMFGLDQLVEMVSHCDYIVMATPYTEATHKLFSAQAVAAMQARAVFINVGRGKCVDEEALIGALQAGAIRGAALDVFYEEPLPSSSALYGLDNVLMSAHCADRTKDFQVESLQLFVENMQRYIGGQALANVVDKAKGY